jgi:tetratricopeptide (TPR) repeat protein
LAETAYEDGEFPLALQAAERFLRAHPDDSRTARVVALCLTKLGRTRDAERFCELASDRLTPDEFQFLARSMLRAGRVGRAEQLMRETLRRWPHHAWTLRNLASLYAAANRNRDAIPLARRLSEIPTEAAVGFALLGTIYQRMDRVQEMIECYQQVLQLDPELRQVPEPAALLKALAEALTGMGRFDEAAPFYHRVLEGGRDAAALHGLGRVGQAAGDMAVAARLWLDALEVDPHFVPALNDLGSVALAEGRAADAVDLYKRAVERDPFSRTAHHGLGLAYQLTGQSELAKVHLARAREHQ